MPTAFGRTRSFRLPKLYETLEVSVLGHYKHFSVKNILNLLCFVHSDLLLPRSTVQKMLDTAAKNVYQLLRGYLSRKCSEWFSPDLN